MNDLENVAVEAIHKAAIDYCDGLTAAGKSQREAALTTMGLVMGEATLIAHAMDLTSKDFQQVAETLHESAESLAQNTRRV